MATLTIRNLPAEVHDALRRRAADNRRSMEAEAREVLRESVDLQPDHATRAKALAALRGMKPLQKRSTPVGWSEVDEFLAEKHLEAAWEAGQVSGGERQLWRQRLERFEIWPAELEAFVASRVVQG